MILANTSPTFRISVGDDSVGDVDVDIIRADGTVLVDGETAVDNDDGTYDITLDAADNTRPDLLRLDWMLPTGEVLSTFEEIVGSLLFALAEARTATTSGLQAPLSSPDDYPDPVLSAWRAHITQQFESRTGYGWVRRHCRIETGGTGDRLLDLWGSEPRTFDGTRLDRPGRTKPAEVLAVTIDGDPVDADVEIRGGYLYRKDGVWKRGSSADPLNISIDYEYGDQAVNPEARTHGLSMIVTKAQPSDVSAFATAFNNRDGSQTLTTEHGWAYPRDVHEWLKRSQRRIVFA